MPRREKKEEAIPDIVQKAPSPFDEPAGRSA